MGVFAYRARGVSVTAFIAVAVLFQPLAAQDAVSPAASGNVAPDPAAVGPVSEPGHPVPGQPVIDKRAFGVLPNYRTTEESIPFKPLTTKQKFTIATKDTLDFPSYFLAGFFAGVSQLNNSNLSFGQGLQGYGRRYISGVADQDIGNFMTEAIMPTFLHEDPRYFRKGHGSIKSRIFYAATRVVVTKTDTDGTTFNFAEFSGNGIVAALGNSYYPDARGFSPTMQRMFTQIGTDSLSGVLKEFWPDVKRKWFHKKTEVAD